MLYNDKLTAMSDFGLGQPKRLRDQKSPADPDAEGNWEKIDGKPGLQRNRVTGKMRYMPQDPTQGVWNYPQYQLIPLSPAQFHAMFSGVQIHA
jgi:hypothetical protein